MQATTCRSEPVRNGPQFRGHRTRAHDWANNGDHDECLKCGMKSTWAGARGECSIGEWTNGGLKWRGNGQRAEVET